eukprot:513596-Hanusia_phi.AAC.1
MEVTFGWTGSDHPRTGIGSLTGPDVQWAAPRLASESPRRATEQTVLRAASPAARVRSRSVRGPGRAAA